jgi:hypothetical protein
MGEYQPQRVAPGNARRREAELQVAQDNVSRASRPALQFRPGAAAGSGEQLSHAEIAKTIDSCRNPSTNELRTSDFKAIILAMEAAVDGKGAEAEVHPY